MKFVATYLPTAAPGEEIARCIQFPAPTPAEELAPCIRSGLAILAEASACAQELQRDAWDFAVEAHWLRDAGLSDSGLRWLLCKGYAVHAVEITRARAPRRSFRRSDSLMFCGRSCFVLTAAGAALAGQPSPRPVGGSGPGHAPASAQPSLWSAVPRWDAARRELRWGAQLVKRFREPALHQELVLAAFEEEGWPPHLDDPLPNHSGADPKERLRDTIKRLNRHQIHRLLRFRGDGNGTGILWEALG